MEKLFSQQYLTQLLIQRLPICIGHATVGSVAFQTLLVGDVMAIA